MDIKEMRREYPRRVLSKKDLKEDPLEQFLSWFQEAVEIQTIEVNAMSLATATKEGRASCRTVLLKQFDESGLRFYTNYESRKAKELKENPFATALLFWHEQMRQIIIEGKVEAISEEDSSAYFRSRPRGSQIGAWASRQDRPLSSRGELDRQFQKMRTEFEGKQIPLPPYWGGYRLLPHRFEFWQGHADRLHDRFEYLLEGKEWKITRLAP